jgi:hypothetical protein
MTWVFKPLLMVGWPQILTADKIIIIFRFSKKVVRVLLLKRRVGVKNTVLPYVRIFRPLNLLRLPSCSTLCIFQTNKLPKEWSSQALIRGTLLVWIASNNHHSILLKWSVAGEIREGDQNTLTLPLTRDHLEFHHKSLARKLTVKVVVTPGSLNRANQTASINASRKTLSYRWARVTWTRERPATIRAFDRKEGERFPQFFLKRGDIKEKWPMNFRSVSIVDTEGAAFSIK